MSISDMTEAELIAEILKAQEGDSGDLPRCGPGEVCAAMLKWKLNLTDRQARYAIAQAYHVGLLEPTWVTYTDPWGTSKKTKGFKLTKKNPGG